MNLSPRSMMHKKERTIGPSQEMIMDFSETSIWDWDVFLSFRGKDTGRKFTDHLYHNLIAKNIRVFREAEGLQTGDEISTSLVKAIERSRLSVVIFSKDYASSTWCLDDLATIRKCMEERKQRVIPIFYEVDPSELQKKMDVQEQKYGKDRVQNWKSALEEVSMVKGESYVAGYEHEFLEKIVNKIMSFLGPHKVLDTEKADFEQSRSKGSKSLPSKKRETQNSGSYETLDGHMLLGNEDQLTSLQGSNLDLNKHVDHGASGNLIGKMLISTVEIATGSNGTIVYEGIYEGRRVAVKRLVRARHDVAFKEIQNLIASDTHPNIVRWYGVEYDKDFVYLSLERCTCSLGDLIQGYSNSYLDLSTITGSLSMKDLNLWKANGQPSSQLLTVLRDIVSGLVHLHELGIIHRDLKPQNVLIIKERLWRAKLSDMGISKRLLGENSSLDHHATGCGSSGWQAPEQLLHGRQTRSIDLFSLGCVLFYCITGGRHPFGEHYERDNNIVTNQMNLFLLDNYLEALDLISRLLSPNPELRPKAAEVLQHPMFWSSETRLSFLRDTSDIVELEDRKSPSDILKALESVGLMALGGEWNEEMEPIFINNLGHYRRYKFDSVRDLLRVIRNKLNHYRELPKEVQELLGPIPEGYDSYFAVRFPKLLIEVYKVVYHFCREEEFFQKYFKSNVI